MEKALKIALLINLEIITTALIVWGYKASLFIDFFLSYNHF